MIRKICATVGTLLAVALAGSCHNDSNTMTGPVVSTTPVPRPA
ncbi:MAG TPA: hypothetical protein VMR54_05635 [Thermoanaerobaculia bacterium]|nr:hypothetical protein [Thermoanaerobaculia bacterium]